MAKATRENAELRLIDDSDEEHKCVKEQKKMLPERGGKLYCISCLKHLLLRKEQLVCCLGCKCEINCDKFLKCLSAIPGEKSSIKRITSATIEKSDECSKTKDLEAKCIQLQCELDHQSKLLQQKETDAFNLHNHMVQFIEKLKGQHTQIIELLNEREAWINERLQLQQKIQELQALQQTLDSFKGQLIAKDSEISKLKEEIKSLKPLPVIGIDIGTSHSCIAFSEDGEVQTIQNERCETIVRSCLKFANSASSTDEDPFSLGAESESVNVIPCIKRFLCSNYEESLNTAKEIAPNVDIRKGDGTEPEFRVLARPGDSFTAVELYSFILTKLKATAERHFGGRRVRDAVVTVPDCFSQFQRQAVLDAANIAGLKNVRLACESSALVRVYEKRADANQLPKCLLFVSMGGGHTTVSCWRRSKDGKGLEMQNSHSLPFGGEDIDGTLVKHCLQYSPEPTSISNSSLLIHLKEICRKAKEDLSSGIRRVDLKLDFNSIPFNFPLSKEQFDEIVLTRVWPKLDNLINKAAEDQSPDEIVITGGSLRIPCLLAKLKDNFPNARLCKSLNYGEVVAHGAALSSFDTSCLVFPMKLCLELFCSSDRKYGFTLVNYVKGLSKLYFSLSWPKEFTNADASDAHLIMRQNNRVVADCQLNRVQPGDVYKVECEINRNGIIDGVSFGFGPSSNWSNATVTEFGMQKNEIHKIALRLQSFLDEIASRKHQKEVCNRLDQLIAFAENVDHPFIKRRSSEWNSWFAKCSNEKSSVLLDKYREIKDCLKRCGFDQPG